MKEKCFLVDAFQTGEAQGDEITDTCRRCIAAQVTAEDSFASTGEGWLLNAPNDRLIDLGLGRRQYESDRTGLNIYNGESASETLEARFICRNSLLGRVGKRLEGTALNKFALKNSTEITYTPRLIQNK